MLNLEEVQAILKTNSKILVKLKKIFFLNITKVF